jgi:hypothetical protein
MRGARLTSPFLMALSQLRFLSETRADLKRRERRSWRNWAAEE